MPLGDKDGTEKDPDFQRRDNASVWGNVVSSSTVVRKYWALKWDVQSELG